MPLALADTILAPMQSWAHAIVPVQSAAFDALAWVSLACYLLFAMVALHDAGGHRRFFGAAFIYSQHAFVCGRGRAVEICLCVAVPAMGGDQPGAYLRGVPTRCSVAQKPPLKQAVLHWPV